MSNRFAGTPTVGVAIIGHGFMARAHAMAWWLASEVFELPVTPVVRVLAGRDLSRATHAAARLQIPAAVGDWREVIGRDNVSIVDICTPVDSHAEIAASALAAGQHVLCEKPLALSPGEAREMVAAADRAATHGIISMVGFNYRRVPALALAARICREGRIGRVRQVRARYLQDWLADPGAEWSWRLDASTAGAGALADLGSHLIDLIHAVTGETFDRVLGDASTFVSERPLPGLGSSRRLAAVTVDDACSFLARSPAGTLSSVEVSRVSHGAKNGLTLDIDGDRGALTFALERLNELRYYSADDPAGLRGFRTILITEPEHPYIDAWWPAGHVLGWDHTFVHQARDFILAIGNRVSPAPDFADGAYVQDVIDAVSESIVTMSWQPVRAKAEHSDADPASAVIDQVPS